MVGRTGGKKQARGKDRESRTGLAWLLSHMEQPEGAWMIRGHQGRDQKAVAG